MKTLFGLLCVGVIFVVCASVFAMPTYIDGAPPLWRGAVGSTVQGWEFGTNDKTPDADLLYNPYGTPELEVSPTRPGYQALWGGYEGVWHLSGVVNVVIPNNLDLNEYKIVQVQIVWASEDGTSVPCVDVFAWLDGVDGALEAAVIDYAPIVTQLGPTGVAGAGEYWYHSVYTFRVEPNPVIELVTIGSAVWIDGVVIDTICIPEPATVCLMGVAALAFLRKQR